MATRPAESRLLVLLLVLLFLISIQFGSADQKNISAKPGDNVTLPCTAATNDSVKVAEWSRIDLRPDHVILFRDKQIDPEGQFPSFKDRVALQDVDHGNVSLILKNVTTSDTGMYECRVIQTENNRTKRNLEKDIDPISIVNLTVEQEIKNRGRKYEKKDGEEMDGGEKDGGNTDREKKDGSNKEWIPTAVCVCIAVAIAIAVISVIVYCIKKRLSSRPEASEHELEPL